MSERRRMLMAIVNQFKWLPYSYEYLYHDLIPQVINGKDVKNKAKVSTIYGNSVVENQQVKYGDFPSNTSFNVTEPAYESAVVSDNKMTCTLLQNISSGCEVSIYGNMFYPNHKYLARAKVKSLVGNNTVRIGFTNTSGEYVDKTISQGNTDYVHGLVNLSGTQSICIIRFQGAHSSGNSFEISEYEIIDLTQAYPFDTPTTLTDNRVQALLNRGYIPYNTGEIKSVDIGEFSSEPYNLFDEILEGGYINESTGVPYPQANSFRVKNYIKVISGQTYTLSHTDIILVSFYVYEYDGNYNFIKSSPVSYGTTSEDKTLTNDTHYIKVACYKANSGWGTNPPSQNDLQLCFHQTGTRTGYAPYQAPQTISFKYQGSGVGTSHDTMEIGKDNVVFMKNMSSYTFSGSENWSYDSTNLFFAFKIIENAYSFKLPSSSATVSNCICDILMNTSGNESRYDTTKNMVMFFTNAGYIGVRNTTYTDLTSFKNWIANYKLTYELETSQTTTIPRKHLGVVDLGSLAWSNVGGTGNASTAGISLSVKKPANNSTPANIYSSFGRNIDYNSSWGNEYIVSVNISGALYVKIPELANGTSEQVAQKLSGQYLFYETNDETTDILDTINIEPGGTINANWFGWVENQQLAISNTSSQTTNGITFTNNNDGSITISGLATADTTIIIRGTTPAQTHKYLLKGCKGGSSSTYYLYDANYVNSKDTGNGVIYTYGYSWTSNISLKILNGTNIVAPVTFYPQLIDLTLAFGSGNEPTNINDPRIQYILNQGYIPTNTNGTYKHVDCEVLPNVEFKMKCK